MRRVEVIDHFGGSQAEVARVLGIRPVCISKWHEVIPESCATRLHILTGQKLAYDPALYDKLKHRKPVPYREAMAKLRQRERERLGNGRENQAA